MKMWIASASLALAIAAGAALPASANQLDYGHPFATQQSCGYVWTGNHYDWRCVKNGAPLQWQTYTAPRQPWAWNNGWGQQQRWNQSAYYGSLVPESAIRQQLWYGGYRDVARLLYDDDDNVYRVLAKDGRGRDVKLVFDAYTGRLVGKTTNTHD
jgi:hypothetical protein